VDDSRTIQFTLKKMLEQDGYNILVAGDGVQAIDMAKAHDPDLILMDVIMPGINGFRATRMLNNDEQTADIPIIMMSADEQAMQEFWINKIGAKDFLNKPFDRAQLFHKVEKFLRIKMVA
jgi:twitching motility two-component system response regulator PilH